jgi:methionyl-tRNA formyltransferase
MEITILCTDNKHKIIPFLEKWAKFNSSIHNISILNNSSEVEGGDILFLISCLEIIKYDLRNKFKHALVIHESDLPHGKGWSPIQWQILNGFNSITITLLDAADKVDSGNIWKKEIVEFKGHELANEINEQIFSMKLNLMDFAIKNMNSINKTVQKEITEPHFPRRTPEDSEININMSISEQFNLLRIADDKRYPCFFNYKGYSYKISLTKINTE